MTPTLKICASLAAALVLSACASTQDRLSSDTSASAPSTMAVSPLGDPSDPTSVAYFNEAVGDRVLFEVDQHTLSPEGERVLAAQANWLNQNPEYAAIIEGHADEQGTREYNLALSARRASSAQNFLIANGVAATRLRTKPLGKERPIAICSDESCYQQNRRAVTVVSAGTPAF